MSETETGHQERHEATVAALAAARAEVAALRERERVVRFTVEHWRQALLAIGQSGASGAHALGCVRAALDGGDADELGIPERDRPAFLRAILDDPAPVEPSGEAESGQAHPQFSAFLQRALADPETRAAYDVVMARDAAPVSSGGQADGEGEYDDVYPTAADIIASEKAVNDRLRADLAARPVLSREALRERLGEHLVVLPRGVNCGCGQVGWNGPRSADDYLDHLADVLVGEQR